jgi:hypothetical protein
VARGPLPRCPGLAGLALAVGLLGAPAARAAEELPAVARPRLPGAADGSGSGTVFFLALPDGPVAAVGAAHSFDLGALAGATAVEFRLGRTGAEVARSERLLAPPGRAFADARGSLRGDLVIFALAAPPAGARALEPGTRGEAREGTRVRILGIPALVPQDEDDLFGRIVKADADRLEVDLDVQADLRGWGGAPVLSAQSGRVLGLLEAALPGRDGFRLGAAPIEAVLEAAAAPLEGGRGAPFARFAAGAEGAPRDPAPERAAADASREREREGEIAALEEEVLDRGGELGDEDAPPPEAEPEPSPGPGEFVQPKRAPARVELTIDYPGEGEVFGGPVGAFLAGQALAIQGELRRFDVMIVLDTSGSTGDMTGADVNGNGLVGSGGLSGLFRGNDPGDSVLAAEVAGALRLLEQLDPRIARVGVVSFSGTPSAPPGTFILNAREGPPAVTEQPLTTDFRRVADALQRVLARGPYGSTHMAAGLDQATIELLGLRGAVSDPNPESSKVVLFLTDGLPTLPIENSLSDNVMAAVRAAERARKAHIQVHTFAIGQEALSGPIAPIEIANRTRGVFTPVRHPAEIVAVMEEVSLANIDSVAVRNLTTGKDADELSVSLDGSWNALVALAPGRNRIEVVARSSDGVESRRELELQSAPDAALPPVPPALATGRNVLLERRLAKLKQVAVAIEQQKADQTRRELALEIERERRQAHERAAVQRRELRLDVERPAGDVAAPAKETP